jgi:hypothetical protein
VITSCVLLAVPPKTQATSMLMALSRYERTAAGIYQPSPHTASTHFSPSCNHHGLGSFLFVFIHDHLLLVPSPFYWRSSSFLFPTFTPMLALVRGHQIAQTPGFERHLYSISLDTGASSLFNTGEQRHKDREVCWPHASFLHSIHTFQAANNTSLHALSALGGYSAGSGKPSSRRRGTLVRDERMTAVD